MMTKLILKNLHKNLNKRNLISNNIQLIHKLLTLLLFQTPIPLTIC